MTVVWMNGLLFDETLTGPPAHAGVNLLDPGLLTGDGVFTTLAVYDNQPFALNLHLERLSASANHFGFDTLDRAAIHQGITSVLSASVHGAADTHAVSRMRITVWRAAAGEAQTSLSVALFPAVATPLGQVNPEKIAVISSEFLRNERSAIAGHKSTSYAENALALRAARERGASEAILFNTQGHLSEGTLSNVVVEYDGELLTPELASGCLPGITRRLALKWATEAGLPMREADPGELTRDIVGNPAALLGTLRNVQSISRWDDATLAPGSLIPELQRVFAEQSAQYSGQP